MTRTRPWLLAIVVVTVNLSCSGAGKRSAAESAVVDGGATTADSQPGVRVPIGAWGGQGLALVVTEAGAHLEFDCGSGEIVTPLMADVDGALVVEGVFVPGRPGPVRDNEEPARFPARYEGRVSADRLTLAVTLTDTRQSMGSFTLVKGGDATLRKCL